MRMRVCLANVFICMRRTSARKRVYMQMCPVIIEAALKCLLLLMLMLLLLLLFYDHVWVLTICFCALILFGYPGACTYVWPSALKKNSRNKN